MGDQQVQGAPVALTRIELGDGPSRFVITGIVTDEAAQVVIASLLSAADAMGGPLVIDLHGCVRLDDAAALALTSCVTRLRAGGVRVDLEAGAATEAEAALARQAGGRVAA